MPLTIETEVVGLGQLLKTSKLRVPVHQRAFSWSAEEVGQLWDDAIRALFNDPEGYFVGPVVLSDPAEDDPRQSVIDGQQRLATASLLYAAVSAAFRARGDSERARVLQNYLGQQSLRNLETEPNLILGDADDGYFRNLVSSAATGRELPEPKGHHASHLLLKQAYDLVFERVETRAKAAGKSWVDSLSELCDFFESSVEVIVVTVASTQNAYLIFETLNDRGLRLNTSDLLKNHLFGQAGSRLEEVRRAWLEMEATLDALDSDEAAPLFLRHFWISSRGMVRSRELFKTISEEVRGPAAAVQLATDLANSSERYVSLASPSSTAWRTTPVRESLEVLARFRVTTPRPLLLAALESLPRRAFEKIVAAVARWSVRLAISGGLGSGALEEAYGDSARRIRSGKISTEAQLKSDLVSLLPADETFEAAFSTKSIRNKKQARYLLAALESEKRKRAGKSAELGANQDETTANLEHIMPKNPPTGSWDHVRDDEQALYLDRIGNLCLMLANANFKVGPESFEAKKSFYSKSELLLTSDLERYDHWTPQQISERQKSLASLAVARWPL